MSQVFWRRGMDGTATFSLFFRGYPKDRSYYIANGIDQAIDFLEDFHFDKSDIEAIRETTHLSSDFLSFLSKLRFTGDVRAMPEGTIVFEDEPLLEVTASIIQAQIVETMLLNIVTTESLFATKASRIVQAAAGSPVVDFGSRRTHGEDAAIAAARSGYISGFAGTSNVKAATLFGIPAFGTMAHSFVQAFDDEPAAFAAYLREFPHDTTLLVDTYDTAEGIGNAIALAKSAVNNGARINAIRIDSGNLFELASLARNMLDKAGLTYVKIMATGGLDEHSIHDLIASDAPIDAFGVGTRFGTSADAPYIDSVYKLVELDGCPITKLSSGKSTRPWRKQVFRRYNADLMDGDLIARARSAKPTGYSDALLCPAMAGGKRLYQPEPVKAVRDRIAANLRKLPDRHLKLRAPQKYPVEYSRELT